jgi:hypothetical protein
MKKLSFVVALVFLFGACFCFAGEAHSQQPQGSQQEATHGGGPSEAGSGTMDGVGRVLLVFLVLSVVFEVALTPIFNWRLFMAHFEERGLKTPITVVLAFVVFWSYGLDIISELLTALDKPTGRSLGGQILTALLIAGGSSGVFQIFTKLGIRMNTDDRKKKAEEAKKRILEKKEGLQDKEKQQ